MNWYWTWSGKSFGYRSGDDLFSVNGTHVGYFVGDEVYACSDGRYLGEVRNDKFLITNKSKKNHRHNSKARLVGTSYVGYADYSGYAMYAGYEDFPEVDE